MTDSVKEQLSACLDDELAATELDLLVRRLGRDAELRSTLSRYALISGAVRGDQPIIPSRDFAANVMAAIDVEPGLATDARSVGPSAWSRRLRPVAGLAVAAGVAAVAVMTIQGPQVGPAIVADNTPAAVSPSLTASESGPSYTVPTTTSTSAFVPAARLTNYVVAHSEYSSPLGRRTVLSGVLSEGDDATSASEPTEESPVVETQVTNP